MKSWRLLHQVHRGCLPQAWAEFLTLPSQFVSQQEKAVFVESSYQHEEYGQERQSILLLMDHKEIQI